MGRERGGVKCGERRGGVKCGEGKRECEVWGGDKGMK